MPSHLASQGLLSGQKQAQSHHTSPERTLLGPACLCILLSHRAVLLQEIITGTLSVPVVTVPGMLRLAGSPKCPCLPPPRCEDSL